MNSKPIGCVPFARLCEALTSSFYGRHHRQWIGGGGAEGYHTVHTYLAVVVGVAVAVVVGVAVVVIVVRGDKEKVSSALTDSTTVAAWKKRANVDGLEHKQTYGFPGLRSVQ